MYIPKHNIKTVGLLRELIKDLPDHTPIVSYQSDMEKRGYQSGTFMCVSPMREETRMATDGFDYTVYPYIVYVDDVGGKQMLVIN